MIKNKKESQFKKKKRKSNRKLQKFIRFELQKKF